MRMLFASIVVGLLLLTPTYTTVAQSECEDRMDLAAITLAPRDYSLVDFVHIGAFDESLQSESAIMASYLGFTRSPVEMRAFLSEQGWQRKYLSRIGNPIENLPGRYSQIIYSYVTEYCDAAGASSAFAVLEDESNAQRAEDLEPTRQFGEETDLTADEGIDSDNHGFRSLDLSFRVGNHVGGVTLAVYPTSDGVDPDQGYLESLAAIVEERLLAPPDPGPGFSLARFHPDETVTFDDTYYRFGGSDTPLAGESDASAEIRTGGYGKADSVYQLFQDVQSGSGQSVLYSLTVYEFNSESDASTWLDEAQDLIETNTFYANMVEVDVESNTSRAFRFAPFGNSDNALMVLTQTGTVVHRVQLVPSAALPEIPLALGEVLMDVQLACFASGDCISIPVPEPVIQLIEAPPASPVA